MLRRKSYLTPGLFFLLLLGLFMVCCASDPKKDGEGDESGDVETSQEGDAADAGQDPANEGGQQFGGENTGLSDTNNLATEPSEAQPTMEAGPTEAPSTATPVNLEGGASAQPMAPMAMGSSDRVVRYVSVPQAKVLDGPGGHAVDARMQGDAVVVNLEGDWGKIADGRYIAAAELMEAIVPRVLTDNGWQK